MLQSTTVFDDLSQKKISRLFWQYALPAIIGMVVNTLYNIIDGVFIGHWVGKDALGALGIILPVMNFAAAIGMLVGVGSASQISINLGKQNYQRAEHIVGTSFVLTLVLSGTALITMLIFLKPILFFVGASDITYPYARDFLQIFLPGSIFLTLSFNFSNMMRSCGYPTKAMVVILISVIANVILAPIFILGFDMGMRGAALATTISMATSFCFTIYHFTSKKSYIRLKSTNLRLRIDIIKSIVSIGLSPFFMQIAASIVVVIINSQLRGYAPQAGINADEAIAAFSNANRLVLLIVMITIGLTQGMQPIVGYNYGMRNYQRVKETLVYVIKIATVITSCGFLLGHYIPHILVKAFSSDASLVALSAVALRNMTMAYIVVGFQIVVASFFQSIGMASKSIFLSLSRQLLLLIPTMLILPLFYGLSGVWYSFPLADVIASLIAAYLLFYQLMIFRKREQRAVRDK